MKGFISIGKARGFLTENRYRFALDEHEAEGMQELLKDLSSHLHVFGQTSTGMTNGNMRVEAERWMRQRRERIQARWDARRERMRHERATAPAIGPTRRQGRL